MENLPFENQVALVTGAASGIGRAAALAFADAGAAVVAVDRNADGIRETVEAVKKAGSEGLALTIDVSDAASVAGMVADIEKQFGRLDIACNNAGIEGTMAPLAEYPVDGFDRVIAVNLRGVFLGMKHQIPLMLSSGGGAIVNVASILGVVGFANAGAYTAAKHGVVGLTKVAAIEYGRQGIRVNAVCPAFIETPMLERAGITSDAEMRESVTALHPIGRLGTAKEIAEAILWLASPQASFVTGTALLADGAYVAQ